MTSVALAAPEDDLRELLTSSLSQAGLTVTAGFGQADVVVVGRPRAGWPETLDELRRATRAPLIAVCRGGDPEAMREALSAGADGIVSEEEASRALGVAIAAAQAGQLSVPRLLRLRLETPPLTARERQILGMIVLSLSNRDIATRLGVEQSTVKTHLSSAFAKLGVKSRSEATAMILDPRNGLGPGILSISGSSPARQRSGA